MKNTEKNPTSAERGEMRCTEATLQTFGITGAGEARGTTGIHVLAALKRHGWKWQPVLSSGRTLGQFLQAEHGDFYIHTSRHAMAYRNGVLVDTAQGGMRRVVLAAVRVWR